MVFHLFVGNRKLFETDKIHIEPFPIGTAGGVKAFTFVVGNKLFLKRIDKKHFSGLKAALFYDMLRRDIQYTDLGGENKHIVVSDIVPCGTQSVSVKYGADGISV